MIITGIQGVLICGNDRKLLNRGPCMYCGHHEFGPFCPTPHGDILQCLNCSELADDTVTSKKNIHIEHLENPKRYDPTWPQSQNPQAV